MEHIMNLQPLPYEMIKNGYKDIEMRLNDEKRQLIKVGDIIIFINRDSFKTIKTKVKDLHRFPSFEALYAFFDKERLGYNPQEEASPKDMEQYYSKEKIQLYGVLGIEIELIK